MNRVAFILQVKADKLEEYKAHHQHVWPEMLAALSATGWHNYSLFVREDGLLFGYFETPYSLQVCVDRMAETEINAKWQALMASYFEHSADAQADQMMLELTEVFHLD